MADDENPAASSIPCHKQKRQKQRRHQYLQHTRLLLPSPGVSRAASFPNAAHQIFHFFVFESMSRVVSLILHAVPVAWAGALAAADNRPGWRLAAEGR